MSDLSMIGWLLAGVSCMGWWLTSRYDAHEREIVNAVNQLGQQVEREIKPALGDLKERIARLERLTTKEDTHGHTN